MSYSTTATTTNVAQQNKYQVGYDELLGGLTYQLTWERFKEIVKRYDFKIAYQEEFIGHGWHYNGRNVMEEEIICFNENNGLVLYASSFGRTAINQATLYGELKCEHSFTGNQKEALANCRTLKRSGEGLAFSMEVGKGFKHHVERLERLFKFYTPWQNQNEEIVMANYTEREQTGRTGWKSKTAQKLCECSSELRTIMNI